MYQESCILFCHSKVKQCRVAAGSQPATLYILLLKLYVGFRFIYYRKLALQGPAGSDVWCKSCYNLEAYKRCVGARGGVVVEALRYKPEGRGIDSRWCHWIFFIDIFHPVAIWSWGRLSL
jgi:hypothetical protein